MKGKIESAAESRYTLSFVGAEGNSMEYGLNISDGSDNSVKVHALGRSLNLKR